MYQWMERRQLQRNKCYRYPLISINRLTYTVVASTETQRSPSHRLQVHAQFGISCISGEIHLLERRSMIFYELKRVGFQPFSQLYQLQKYLIVSCSFMQQCHSFPSLLQSLNQLAFKLGIEPDYNNPIRHRNSKPLHSRTLLLVYPIIVFTCAGIHYNPSSPKNKILDI